MLNLYIRTKRSYFVTKHGLTKSYNGLIFVSKNALAPCNIITFIDNLGTSSFRRIMILKKNEPISLVMY